MNPFLKYLKFLLWNVLYNGSFLLQIYLEFKCKKITNSVISSITSLAVVHHFACVVSCEFKKQNKSHYMVFCNQFIISFGFSSQYLICNEC